MINDINTTAQHTLICSETRSKDGLGPTLEWFLKWDRMSAFCEGGPSLQEKSWCKSIPDDFRSILGRSPWSLWGWASQATLRLLVCRALWISWKSGQFMSLHRTGTSYAQVHRKYIRLTRCPQLDSTSPCLEGSRVPCTIKLWSNECTL